MTLEWPQLTYIAIMILSLGIDLAKHGQFKTGRHDVVNSIIGTAIASWLLYMGGFFK